MRGRQQQQDARPAKVFRGEAATKEQVQQLSADRASLGGLENSGSTGARDNRGSSNQQRRDTVDGEPKSLRQDNGEALSNRGVADGDVGGMANANSDEHGKAGRNSTGDSPTVQGVDWTQKPRAGMPGGAGDSLRGMADTEGVGECPNELRRDSGEGVQLARTEPGGYRGYDGSDAEQKPIPGPTNGFWRDVDWLGCRDGKWRPVEPGTFPLAYGAPARVGRLRAYGNAINAKAAEEFIIAAMGK